MQRLPALRPHGWSFTLFVLCLLVTSSRSAKARQNDASDGDAEVALAENKADRAFQAYQAKRFAEAVALYIEAYNAAPNADILYNIARIYDAKLGDRPLAINFYRRYIAEPGAVADRIQIANERLLALREAEFAATRPSAGTEAATPAAADAPASAAHREPQSGWSTPEVIGVVMASTGVVALGVGAGFGIAAMRETGTVNDLCENNVCSEQRGIDTAKSANDHAMVSTIAFASSGALFALGAVFYFWLGDAPSERQASDTGPRLAARIGQTPGGLALELGGSW
jgi:tetratricopeptide (TPR) repeat protein